MLRKYYHLIFEKYGVYKDSFTKHHLSAFQLFRSPWTNTEVTNQTFVSTIVASAMPQKSWQTCGFEPFEGQTVKAIVVDQDLHATRKVIDGICAEVEVQTANKAFWFKLDENGELVGGIDKVLTDDRK